MQQLTGCGRLRMYSKPYAHEFRDRSLQQALGVTASFDELGPKIRNCRCTAYQWTFRSAKTRWSRLRAKRSPADKRSIAELRTGGPVLAAFTEQEPVVHADRDICRILGRSTMMPFRMELNPQSFDNCHAFASLDHDATFRAKRSPRSCHHGTAYLEMINEPMANSRTGGALPTAEKCAARAIAMDFRPAPGRRGHSQAEWDLEHVVQEVPLQACPPGEDGQTKTGPTEEKRRAVQNFRRGQAVLLGAST